MAGDTPPAGVPYFRAPTDYTTLANWFWDPVSSEVNRWDDLIAGQIVAPGYSIGLPLGGSTLSGHIGDSGLFGGDGPVFKIGIRNVPGEASGWLSALDQNIAQWGNWLSTDPRTELDSYFSQFQNQPNFNEYNIDSSGLSTYGGLNALSSAFSQQAIKQKLKSLGVTDDQIGQVIEGLYDRPFYKAGTAGLTQDFYGPYQGPSTWDTNNPLATGVDQLLNDQTWGPLAKLFRDTGIVPGMPLSLESYQGANVGSISDEQLLGALQAAGITPAAPVVDGGGTTTQPVATGTPLPATFNTQEAAMADNASGVSPTALNPWASFLYELAGKHLKGFDAKGNPVFETSATPGILGEQQKTDIAEYLKPLGLNSTEQYGRGLLDPTSLGNNLNRALGVFDNTVIPGMTSLATDGFRTPTPDLYGGDQYAKARGAMNGRLFDPYQEQAAQGFLNDPLYRGQAQSLVSDMMRQGIPQATRDAAYRDFNQHAGQDLRASLGGQTGSFSTDYLGALARGSADITNQLARESAAYQAQGLGISNQMDQGSREAKDRGLQLLNQMDASERDAMMQALGVVNTMTQTQGALDSSLNESAAARRASGLPMLASTATARAQLPLTFGQDVINAGAANRLTDESLRPGSRTLNTLLQLTGGSAPGNLGYVAQGQLPSATTSLASGLAPFSAAFGQQQGGGSFLGNLLGNANFQNLAVGALSKGIGALGNLFSSGFSSLFGGGNSAQTNTGSSYGFTGQPMWSSQYQPSNPAQWWGTTLDGNP